MRVRAFCPAKVNLFLSVGPPDERGYHPLRTVFQAISLGDELVAEVAEADDVIFSGADVPSENTVTKALRLMRGVVSVPPLRVRVAKAVPPESGLGAGSSDAAGLIRAVERILGAPLPRREEIALAVGADVPFFLVGGRARAEGYGERLMPLEDAVPEWLVIARPGVGCSTPEAFRRLDAITREWREFSETDELYNDFERVAPPESLHLIDRLRALGARDAALSGSGSAVFGRFVHRERAEAAAEGILTQGAASAWTARTLGREESLVARIEPA